MKLLVKIAVNALVPVYIAVSLFTLTDCRELHDPSTAVRLESIKRNTANLLLQKFDARIFDINSSELLNSPVVLDTLILGVAHRGGNNFLRAEIKCGGAKKYYAELKCGGDILNAYRMAKSNSAFLVAKISRIDDCQLIAEADSLDGKIKNCDLGKSVLLSGECLALAEIPAAVNAD